MEELSILSPDPQIRRISYLRGLSADKPVNTFLPGLRPYVELTQSTACCRQTTTVYLNILN